MLSKLAVFFWLVGSCVNLHAQDNDDIKISKAKYFSGGAVGSVIGLGMGHAIQGRYRDEGFIFTIGEVCASALIGGGLGWMSSALEKNQTLKTAKFVDVNKGGFTLFVLGSAALIGFKIWEIIDVWTGASIEDSTQTRATRYMNVDEKRFAGATELGIADVNVPFLSLNF